MSENEQEQDDLNEEMDESAEAEGRSLGVPGEGGSTFTVSGMYREWFLDYASYVILERAVPALYDGLKPVQRRILHSMKDLDDGRYNKVANVIGHTMQYHPHGDASIGDAMVQLGQKDLLIDTQGNWGNTLTGDRAAAPRYIEARLSKFATDVVFNPKTTDWQLSYDGRNKEPVFLPVKFPLLLAQGGEGIAVGLSCKILPHNFIELIDASIAHLRGKRVDLMPDFATGGMADVENYNEGMRGGRVRVRARIRKEDIRTLVIHELPFGSTTSSLIDSIIKANDKGKIKVKKIEDNTSSDAEIVVHLPSGVSPDKTIDALYAFTDCEVSISPNACVIQTDKPYFVSVNELLRHSTDNTVRLLKMELQIKLGELEAQWHFSSLERIFIEKKVYRKIEDAETWEQVIEFIHKGLKPHVKGLKREVTNEDIVRLTEIKIKRISKFDSFKADEFIKGLEDKIKEVKNSLKNLVDHAIDHFKELKKKYGQGRERRTELRAFETIVASKVAASNKKLYVDRKEGFAGYGMRGFEQVCECSDIDDIIVFRSDGSMIVTKVADKKFVGKDILHIAVWKKGDKRTIYHMIYQDGTKGGTYMKRFPINGVTRDKEYVLTRGNKGSRVLHFSANPNGTAEVVQVLLRPRPKVRKLKFDVDLGELAIKGRGAKGNLLTKNMVSKVVVKEVGASTLGARDIWLDESVMRLNAEGQGRWLGKFEGDDKVVAFTSDGYYHPLPFALSTHFPDNSILIVKQDPEQVVSVVHFDGNTQHLYVKRFQMTNTDRPFQFITDHPESRLEVLSLMERPKVNIAYDKRSSNAEDEVVQLADLISLKGEKARGNRLTTEKVKAITLLGAMFDPPIKEQEDVIEKIDPELLAMPGPEELGLEESPMKAYRRKVLEQQVGTANVKPAKKKSGFVPGSQITLELDG